MKPMNRPPLSRRPRGALLRGLGLAAWFAVVPAARADIIAEVREALGSGQLDTARQLVESARAQGGGTPEVAEAMSWIARAQLGRRDFDAALLTSEKTYELASRAAQQHPLDSERHLPVALGAAIEVHAQALAGRGERAKAVTLLRGELGRYGKTSIATRSLPTSSSLMRCFSRHGMSVLLRLRIQRCSTDPQAVASVEKSTAYSPFWAARVILSRRHGKRSIPSSGAGCQGAYLSRLITPCLPSVCLPSPPRVHLAPQRFGP